MSTEEIINAWKHNEIEKAVIKSVKHAVEQGMKQFPVNPAGEQEISDEDLQAVDGGKEASCGAFSCN
jgi:mersacidin/lichenicidin family type 2 lantibiotic